MPDNFETGKVAPTVYFAYGSNLWIDQMNRRCPEHKYIGTGVLNDWWGSSRLGSICCTAHRFHRCWIICQKGYANVIPSKGDHVYGFLYELSPKDEKALDGYEDVPRNYVKKTLPIQLITSSGNGDSETVMQRSTDALVYVDIVNTNHDAPKTEYIHRMNMAMKDAIQMGISQSYIDKYIRPSIPPE